jgi:hypothetical protein
MPLTTPKVPGYCHHKASGQAYITLNGRVIYLGKHGSAASKAEYDRRIAEWCAAGRMLAGDQQEVTVAEVIWSFLARAAAISLNLARLSGARR